MEDLKIMENMKEVLKKTRKSKHKKTRAETDEKEGEEISEILSKNWKFSSPPAQQKQPIEEPKVNAFERMMAKKAEPLAQISPEVNGIKKKRKYTKKPKFNKLDDEADDADESRTDENNELKRSERTLDDENLARKRTRAQEESEVDSPRVAEVISKKRRTKSDKLLILDANENSIEAPVTPKTDSQPLDDVSTTPSAKYSSSRPRRSCAGKVNYELLISPDKKISPEASKRRGKKTEDDTPVKKSSQTRKNKPENSPEVLEIEDETPKKPKKLAPLFVKKVPKPSIDPAVKEARRNFLLSGLPEEMRSTIDKQRQFEDEILSNELVAYPVVAHVTQSLEQLEEVSWSNSRVKIKQDDEDYELTPQKPLSLGVLTNCNPNEEVPLKKPLKPPQEKIENLKEIVKVLKNEFGSFPTYRSAKLLCAKFQEQKNDFENLFTEVFKPLSFDEFLVNTKPVKELQNFLMTWDEKDNEYDSDESSSRQSSKGLSNNFAVLSGGHGSGKTSSVYALARDLNYQVIEINAGTRRSGKKMLQDLLEATQSHRVKEQNSQDLNRSIILIEDAELTFESDDGFVAAIQQLINISKRPVLLTTNDRNCQHLLKFIAHKEIVYEPNPKSQNIGKYLSLLCLAANHQISAVASEHLYTLNGRDLRKTINAIEFFIRSGAVNDGDLIGLCRPPRSESYSNKTLSTVHFESSIASDFAARWRAENNDGSSYQQRVLTDDIAEFLNVKIRRDLAEGKQNVIESSISSNLISLSTNLSTTRALSLDYSSMLREICRSEKVRCENGRRTTANNRGHYLRFLITKSGNDYFNEQCEMFQQ